MYRPEYVSSNENIRHFDAQRIQEAIKIILKCKHTSVLNFRSGGDTDANGEHDDWDSRSSSC